jgi:hypothetical protein
MPRSGPQLPQLDLQQANPQLDLAARHLRESCFPSPPLANWPELRSHARRFAAGIIGVVQADWTRLCPDVSMAWDQSASWRGSGVYESPSAMPTQLRRVLLEASTPSHFIFFYGQFQTT